MRLWNDGYRLYLWNEWVSTWKHYTYVCRNVDGTIETDEGCKDIIGTREEFEDYLKEIYIRKRMGLI